MDISVVQGHALPLDSSTAVLRLFLETVPDAVILADARGSVLSFSPAAERLFGYAPQEVIGRPIAMLMSPPQDWRPAGAPGAACAPEATGRKKTGERFPAQLAVGETLVNGSSVFTTFVRDMSWRRQAEQRIAALQQEVIQMSRFHALGQMALALAHELNQPLTAIGHYALAAKRCFTLRSRLGIEQSFAFMDKASDQAQRAGQIIRKLRQFARHHAVSRVRDDLCAAVDEVTQMATVGVAQRGIAVETSYPPEPVFISMDRIHIQQAVANLLCNAVDALGTWPHERRIAVTVARRPGDEAEVVVRDSGRGIAPHDIERIFEPLHTTKPDGIGLGLTLSRRIVEAHGGRIVAESVPGQGAVFRLILPTRGPSR